MIASSGKGGIAAHWEFLVLALGVIALGVGGYVFFCGGEADLDFSTGGRAIEPEKVVPVQLAAYESTLKGCDHPAKTALVKRGANDGDYLSSERRKFCAKCKMPIAFAAETCPLCKAAQAAAPKIVLDKDGDGLPDEWEKKFGLNADVADANADKDGDGFTNAEEFAAKTDPSDPKSHPDYLDSLELKLPLKETVLAFYFEKYMPIGKMTRFYFKDPKKLNDYGKPGVVYSVLADEDIGKTGYKVKKFIARTKKVAIKGSNVQREVDCSEAVIVRMSDKREIAIALGEKSKPIDVQAILVYNRGGVKEMPVVPGDTIDLNGSKYRVKTIQGVGNGARVTLEDAITGKLRIIESLAK